jgi:hypothetical protein
MTSDEFRFLIPGYLSQQMTEAEKAIFERKLAEDPEFALEVAELRSTWQDLGSAPAQQPSAALHARFYQRLNELDRGVSRSPASDYAWWRPGLSGLVRQATIVLTLLCVGVYVGRLTAPRSAASEDTAGLRDQVQSLRQAVALSLMDRQSASSRLEGISWSSRVSHPDSDLLSALVNTLNHDSNTNVRLASLDALEKFSGDASVRQALVASLPLQTSPLVQIALIDGLVQIRDRSVAGELKTLSRSGSADAAVRQRAQWGLEKLSSN